MKIIKKLSNLLIVSLISANTHNLQATSEFDASSIWVDKSEICTEVFTQGVGE